MRPFIDTNTGQSVFSTEEVISIKNRENLSNDTSVIPLNPERTMWHIITHHNWMTSQEVFSMAADILGLEFSEMSQPLSRLQRIFGVYDNLSRYNGEE